jgi:MHS family proline/betaine transporter-like MFS transporter
MSSHSNVKKIVHIFLLLFISACGSYTLMGYVSTYVHEFLKLSLAKAFAMQTIFIVIPLFFLPLFSLLADRVGRKKVLDD